MSKKAILVTMNDKPLFAVIKYASLIESGLKIEKELESIYGKTIIQKETVERNDIQRTHVMTFVDNDKIIIRTQTIDLL